MKYSTKNIVKILLWLIGLFGLSILYTQFPFYKLFPQFPILQWIWIYGGFFMIAIAFVFLVHENNWLKGQRGEDDVFDILKRLPKEFSPLEDLRLSDRGNIDEVVVGPTGIWAIEVKNVRGNITYNGERLFNGGYPLNALNQALAEAYAVRDKLNDVLKKEYSYSVQPVVVFLNPDNDFCFDRKLKGVYVIKSSELNDLIQKEIKQRLNSSEIEEIAKVLEKYQE